jgi:hypothetical protein
LIKKYVKKHYHYDGSIEENDHDKELEKVVIPLTEIDK